MTNDEVVEACKKILCGFESGAYSIDIFYEKLTKLSNKIKGVDQLELFDNKENKNYDI